MISFRHHVITLVAVFLALAVGVVLGGGPLSDVGLGATKRLDQERARTASLEREVATNDTALAYAGDLVRQLGDPALGGRLEGVSVAVVTTPGVDDGLLAELNAAVVAAGGVVTGTVQLGPALLRPSEKTLVDSLSSQLATQVDASGVVGEASTYVRTGQLLGQAVATTGAAAVAADDSGAMILETLRSAELVDTPEADRQSAPLILVVLGDEQPVAGDPVVSGLLAGLNRQARGVVVAGPGASAADGVLQRLRADDADVGSTVDGVDTGAGQVTTILALAASYAGTTGDFGASGSDGTPPLG